MKDIKKHQQKQKDGAYKPPPQKNNTQHQHQQTSTKNNKTPFNRIHLPAQADAQPAPQEAETDRLDLAQKVDDLQQIVLKLLEIIKGLVPAADFNNILTTNKQNIASPCPVTSC